MGIALPRLRRKNKIEKEPKFLYFAISVLGLTFIAPLYFLVIQAFKPLSELFLYPPRFYVMRPTIDNFSDLLIIAGQSWVPFSRYLFNSLFVTTAVVVLNVILASMAAYPMAKSKAPGMKAFFDACVAALMFSTAVIAIARYLIVDYLGILNTYWALILPVLAAPFGAFLMKQFLEQTPDSLIEAAKMDGASHWGIFMKVVMPLSRPAWATLSIFAFIGAWNDVVSPMFYTTSDAMKTLPLALQTMFTGEQGIAYAGAQAAASFLTVLPTIVFFLILQKRVISTMANAGIKS